MASNEIMSVIRKLSNFLYDTKRNGCCQKKHEKEINGNNEFDEDLHDNDYYIDDAIITLLFFPLYCSCSSLSAIKLGANKNYTHAIFFWHGTNGPMKKPS